MNRPCKDCKRIIKKKHVCNSCSNRRYRKRNPMRYAFNNLRENSQRRNISFALSFEQFKKFAIKTEYIQNKGTTKESFSIDRVNNNKGYTVDNIQILTVGENASKGIKKIIEWNEYAGQLKTRTLKPKKEYDPNEDW